ncbi:DUF599 domain-containing protein [Congregibacter brevis]|uniref:DUF599 domain-containing protein n=1 Tax=Congregibacter brevis TaxID=3081201 RepID=A0ABZ0IBA4_9GAMM|nr:DUF599 domain-containing protein [Congregibacter sp. IMCC45268]
MQIPFDVLEIASLAYFLLLWAGYARYAKFRAKRDKGSSLSRSLRDHREAWAERMLSREMRMTDASLLASQERVVGFFASATLLLMAGVLTALTTSDQIAELSSHIPFAEHQSNGQVEAKLALLLVILIYAFFKVTWSLRQYGFAAVVMGAAPDVQEEISSEQKDRFVCNLAKLMDSAGHDNNSGLRAYYFGLSVMCWLFGTVPFLLATTITVLVLYRREFVSNTVQAIRQSLVLPVGSND